MARSYRLRGRFVSALMAYTATTTRPRAPNRPSFFLRQGRPRIAGRWHARGPDRARQSRPASASIRAALSFRVVLVAAEVMPMLAIGPASDDRNAPRIRRGCPSPAAVRGGGCARAAAWRRHRRTRRMACPRSTACTLRHRQLAPVVLADGDKIGYSRSPPRSLQMYPSTRSTACRCRASASPPPSPATACRHSAARVKDCRAMGNPALVRLDAFCGASAGRDARREAVRQYGRIDLPLPDPWPRQTDAQCQHTDHTRVPILTCFTSGCSRAMLGAMTGPVPRPEVMARVRRQDDRPDRITAMRP